MNIIHQLVELAQTSTMMSRHACALLRGKKILATGINYPSPLIRNLMCMDPSEIRRYGLVLSEHAEQTTLSNYDRWKHRRGRKAISVRKLHLVVIRLNRLGQLCESKPCRNCVQYLQQYGIRKVTYSTENGSLYTENVKTMKGTPSVGYRSLDLFLTKI